MAQTLYSDQNDNNFLTTVQDIDPKNVLAKYHNKEIILVILAFEKEDISNQDLELKGIVIKNMWYRILALYPHIDGCRLSWNTIFFALDYADYEKVKTVFKEITSMDLELDYHWLAVLYKTNGNPAEKLKILDDMEDEVSVLPNFGLSKTHYYRIVDGKEVLSWDSR